MDTKVSEQEVIRPMAVFSQQNAAHRAEVMPGNDGEDVAAGEARLGQSIRVQAVALCACQRDERVDDRHDGHAEHAGLDRAAGDGSRLLHAQAADDVDDDDAESQAGQRVQRVIALQKA